MAGGGAKVPVPANVGSLLQESLSGQYSPNTYSNNSGISQGGLIGSSPFSGLSNPFRSSQSQPITLSNSSNQKAPEVPRSVSNVESVTSAKNIPESESQEQGNSSEVAQKLRDSLRATSANPPSAPLTIQGDDHVLQPSVLHATSVTTYIQSREFYEGPNDSQTFTSSDLAQPLTSQSSIVGDLLLKLRSLFDSFFQSRATTP